MTKERGKIMNTLIIAAVIVCIIIIGGYFKVVRPNKQKKQNMNKK